MSGLENDLNKIAPTIALGDMMLGDKEAAEAFCLALVPEERDTFRGTLS